MSSKDWIDKTIKKPVPTGKAGRRARLAEMLLQSHADEIHLLPALPTAWPHGSITGLCARGGVEVGMTWAAGKLVKARLSSKRGGTYVARFGDGVVKLNLEAGGSIELSPGGFKS